MEPKIEFLEGVIGVDEVKGLLLTNPSVVGRSLEKRLKPRLADLRGAGIPVDRKSLSRLANYTEEQWSTSMEYQEKRLLRGKLW